VVAAIVAVLLIAGLIYAFNYVSGSGGSYAVPDVVGLPVATAEKDIANAHLVSQVTTRASSSVPKGDVISTSPPNGTNVAKDSTVRLFVSSGAAAVAVPDVVNDNVSTATSVLEGKGFQVSQKQVANSTAPAGQVVRQSPSGGASAPKGSTVTIYVSGGGTKVPQVVGDSQATATQQLENDGFSVNPIVSSGSGSAGFTPGTVWKTSPAVGTVLPQGSTVDIYVVPQPTPSPTTPSPSPTSSPSPTGSPT